MNKSLIFAIVLGVAVLAVIFAVGQREDAEATAGENPRMGEGPLVVFLFEDYQCSHCQEYSLGPGFEHLVDRWVRPGNITLVFKHIAFVGPYSDDAARASQCVYQAAPEAWLSWDHAVYAWGAGGSSPDPASLRTLAEASGVPLGPYDDCLAAPGPLDAQIEQNMAEFRAAGLSGTPGMIVAGKVVDPKDSEAVDAAIAEALGAQ